MVRERTWFQDQHARALGDAKGDQKGLQGNPVDLKVFQKNKYIGFAQGAKKKEANCSVLLIKAFKIKK